MKQIEKIIETLVKECDRKNISIVIESDISSHYGGSVEDIIKHANSILDNTKQMLILSIQPTTEQVHPPTGKPIKEVNNVDFKK